MPELFRLFVEGWRHLNPRWEVRVLQRSTVHEYLSEADLPNRFGQMLSHQTTSDCIRLALLARYGGVWLDVSVLLLTSLDELCWEALGESKAAAFFHPHYGTQALGGKDFVESWLLATQPGNPFFLRWRDLLRELLHNRLDVDGLLEHPLYSGLDLQGFERLNREFSPGFDFREYLAIHAMCHRLLETDLGLRHEWQRSWLRIDAAETAFRLQLEAEAAGVPVAEALLGGDARWEAVLRSVPLVKLTTPHYVGLVGLPRDRLLDARGALGSVLRATGVR